ncbi:ribonuclease H, partial [Trifolium medium]|nr:ribonuclease H [Trifolium medium]
KSTIDEHFKRPLNPVMAVGKRAEQYMKSVLLHDVTHKVERVEVMVGWKPPMEGWVKAVKLNTDGAYKEGSVAGCGGVIRDST